MILIGLAGKKRTGKNTVAKYIALTTSQSVEEVAFSDALKNEVAALCKVSRSVIDNNKELYRPLLQAWGEYQKQVHGQDYWNIKCLSRINKSQADIIIVTDVRFPREVSILKDTGAFLVSVSRNTGLVDTHISENALVGLNIKWDEIILNTGTLDQLLEQTKQMMSKFKIKSK